MNSEEAAHRSHASQKPVWMRRLGLAWSKEEAVLLEAKPPHGPSCRGHISLCCREEWAGGQRPPHTLHK